jgi:hypothetical protein
MTDLVGVLVFFQHSVQHTYWCSTVNNNLKTKELHHGPLDDRCQAGLGVQIQDLLVLGFARCALVGGNFLLVAKDLVLVVQFVLGRSAFLLVDVV